LLAASIAVMIWLLVTVVKQFRSRR